MLKKKQEMRNKHKFINAKKIDKMQDIYTQEVNNFDIQPQKQKPIQPFSDINIPNGEELDKNTLDGYRYVAIVRKRKYHRKPSTRKEIIKKSKIKLNNCQ